MTRGTEEPSNTINCNGKSLRRVWMTCFWVSFCSLFELSVGCWLYYSCIDWILASWFSTLVRALNCWFCCRSISGLLILSVSLISSIKTSHFPLSKRLAFGQSLRASMEFKANGEYPMQLIHDLEFTLGLQEMIKRHVCY